MLHVTSLRDAIYLFNIFLQLLIEYNLFPTYAACDFFKRCRNRSNKYENS